MQPIASFDPADAEIVELPTPTAKQEELLEYIRSLNEGQRAIIGYGGALGGAKTSGLLIAAVNYALSYPGARILICRSLFSDLEASTMEKYNDLFPQSLSTYDIGRKMSTFRLPHWPEGVVSRFFWRGVRDFASIKSTEFGFIGIDEGDGIKERTIFWLLGRLRQAIGGRFPKYAMVIASNPSESWFKDWFINGKIDAAKFERAGIGRITFIPSKMSDNPHLPPGYEDYLRSFFPAGMAQALIDGSFDVTEDQWFDNIEDRHIITQQQLRDSSFPTIEVPWKEDKGGKRLLPRFDYAVGGLDFAGPGRDAHYSGGIVYLTLPGGKRDVTAFEFKDRGPGIMGRQETWMRRVELALNRRITWYADKTQPTGIEMLQQKGFSVETNEGKPDSWETNLHMAHDAFQVDGEGIPTSLFLDTCPETIAQFRAYRVTNKALPDGSVKLTTPGTNDDLVDPWLYAHEERYRRRIDPVKRWGKNIVPHAYKHGVSAKQKQPTGGGLALPFVIPEWATGARGKVSHGGTPWR